MSAMHFHDSECETRSWRALKHIYFCRSHANNQVSKNRFSFFFLPFVGLSEALAFAEKSIDQRQLITQWQLAT